MRLSAFDTYTLFLALKNHFTRESYDFFKYQGKTSASHESFMSRKDRFQFQKLSRRVAASEMQDFIIANILSGKTWVGDFLDDDAVDNYTSYLKVRQSLTYVFSEELNSLFYDASPEFCFKCFKNKYPFLLTYLMNRNITLETCVILNGFVGYIDVWDKKYPDDPIWSKYSMMIKKYTPFLEYDKKKLKTILKDKLKEYEHGEEQETSHSSRTESANAA